MNALHKITVRTAPVHSLYPLYALFKPTMKKAEFPAFCDGTEMPLLGLIDNYN